jgi:hypothetical protein
MTRDAPPDPGAAEMLQTLCPRPPGADAQGLIVDCSVVRPSRWKIERRYRPSHRGSPPIAAWASRLLTVSTCPLYLRKLFDFCPVGSTRGLIAVPGDA